MSIQEKILKALIETKARRDEQRRIVNQGQDRRSPDARMVPQAEQMRELLREQQHQMSAQEESKRKRRLY